MLADFHRFAAARDGHRAECKVCALKRAKINYKLRYVPKHPIGPTSGICARCGEEFTFIHTTGRLRRFCGDPCKYRASDDLKKARAAVLPRRACVCGSTDVARVGKPVCSRCKRDKRDPLTAAASERRRTLRKYGLTEADWNNILKRQGGGCGICGTDVPGGRGESWAIDHCHVTNRVRGLLCHNCNIGLGHFRDRLDLLTAAIEYLSAV